MMKATVWNRTTGRHSNIIRKALERLIGMLMREFTKQGEPVNRNEKKRD